MAVVRLSPGVYRDQATGKTINATTQQEAERLAGTAPAAAPARQGAANRPNLPGVSAPMRRLQRSDINVANQEAAANINYGNAGTFATPFGGQSVEIGPDGRPIVNQTLSPEQQRIYEQGTGLTGLGQELAQQQLQGYTPFALGQDVVGDRARIEDEVFKRLTRNLEKDRGTDVEALKQDLYNRGIPLDPTNPVYQREMNALQERYDMRSADAAQRAAEIGGQELSRSYGVQLGAHQQGISDIGALQGMGTGLMLPNLPGFQGSQVQYQSPAELELAWKQFLEGRRQFNTGAALDQQRIALAGRRSGGGGGQESAFEA